MVVQTLNVGRFVAHIALHESPNNLSLSFHEVSVFDSTPEMMQGPILVLACRMRDYDAALRVAQRCLDALDTTGKLSSVRIRDTDEQGILPDRIWA